jgi:ribulose-5-phosphate 4-epimerase/fuculose-1-phosphate aldolase
LVLLARSLWRIGYRDSIAGHITMRLDDGTLLCNPWFLTWEELAPHHVLRIDLDGKVLEGDFPAPRGLPLHLAYHRCHPSAGVVVHSHPHWGTVWADLREVPPPMDQTSATGGGRLALVDEYDGGVNDARAAERAVELAGDAELVLLAGHGVLVVARDVIAAYHRAYSLEFRCRNAWYVRAAGGRLESPLPRPVLDRWEQRQDGLDAMWFAAVRAELRAAPDLLDEPLPRWSSDAAAS